MRFWGHSSVDRAQDERKYNLVVTRFNNLEVGGSNPSVPNCDSDEMLNIVFSENTG